MDERHKMTHEEISSLGGKAGHQKGTAHEWDSIAASVAGRKGGLATQARRRAKKAFMEAQKGEAAKRSGNAIGEILFYDSNGVVTSKRDAVREDLCCSASAHIFLRDRTRCWCGRMFRRLVE